MKHLKLLCGLVWGVLGLAEAKGQELRIGDTLPDYRFGSVLRYSEGGVGLADFKGKVLILDLWRTTCSHAVASFAHFDSLQSEFPERIAVLAVTTEPREFIAAYLDKNVYAHRTKLPVITDDTLLAGKRLPFIYIPHVVVVNPKGIIVGITRPEAVTRTVVQDLIAGRKPSLPLKKEVPDFDYSTPLLAKGDSSNLNRVVYSATYLHRIPGVLSIQDSHTSGAYRFYNGYNVSIPEMYMKAYNLILHPNRILCRMKDRSRIIAPKEDNEDWKDRNLWCYSLILPTQMTHPEQTVLAEFNRLFGIRVSVEKRKMNCLLLVRKGTGERWKLKHPDGEDYYIDSGGVTLIHNVLLSAVSDAFDYASRLPIIDKTHSYGELADMKIEGNPNQLLLFRKQLQKYDLDLIPAVETLDVMVIREGK